MHNNMGLERQVGESYHDYQDRLSATEKSGISIPARESKESYHDYQDRLSLMIKTLSEE